MAEDTNIKTKTKIDLRHISMEDALLMYRWVSDPFVAMNMGLRTKPTLERTQLWIKRALEDPSVRCYAIEFEGVHVGNVILDKIDEYLQSARLSIYIGDAKSRCKGVAQQAILEALEDAFTFFELNKVWLIVHAKNKHAIELYENIGFQNEGTLRDEFWYEGRRVDVFYYGLLKSEFKH